MKSTTTFIEYTATYTTELANIDSLINNGDITEVEYQSLLQDAYSDYSKAIATL